MNKPLIPMNLQLFAEGGAGAGDPGNAGASGNAGGATGSGTGSTAGAAAATPEIDYDKLAGIIAGKEDGILKGYLKQQGLSKEEMDAAVKAYKDQKAANTPDVGKMQSDLTAAQAALQQAQLNNAATMAAIGLGIDVKVVPYILKMADLSKVVGQDGQVNEDSLKEALNKVLEDVPGLKPTAQQQAGIQFGNSQSGGQAQSSVDDQLDRIFGVKKK